MNQDGLPSLYTADLTPRRCCHVNTSFICQENEQKYDMPMSDNLPIWFTSVSHCSCNGPLIKTNG